MEGLADPVPRALYRLVTEGLEVLVLVVVALDRSVGDPRRRGRVIPSSRPRERDDEVLDDPPLEPDVGLPDALGQRRRGRLSLRLASLCEGDLGLDMTLPLADLVVLRLGQLSAP